MRHWLVSLCLVCCLSATAQQQTTWEQVWHEVINTEDMDAEEAEATYERLQQLSEHPINLNNTSREELEQLPFLSDLQIDELIEYLLRYGPMRSYGELRMIRAMDFQQLALLPFFVEIGEAPEKKKTFPRWSNIARYGKHTLTLTGRLPFYSHQGDLSNSDKSYLGPKYRHSLRYEFSYGRTLKLGFVGAQDAGEPFFSSHNPWGYDAYSYYLQVQRLGRLENAILGKYKISAGMGLVLNTGFSLGKQVMLQNLGRQSNSLRPHGSRSEADYMQGAAATVRLFRPLTATLFASYRPVDATLNTDGSVATIITSGYHRTLTELQKKYNTHQTDLGATINYRHKGLRLGANAVYTSFDRRLSPNTKEYYRLYYPQGEHFLNTSLDYGYKYHHFTLNGETAINGDGALATIHTLGYQSDFFSIMALQRFYSYRYNSIHAHSFGETSRTQNESGYYLGLTWNPFGSLNLQGYVDYAYFPWQRYQVSQPSHAWDFMLQADYQLQRWSLSARHRLRLRQKDNADKTALIPDNQQRGRITLTYAHPSNWSAKTEYDYALSDYKTASRGYMVSEHVAWSNSKWQTSLTAGYFYTGDHNSRIYIYERQMQHDFSFPMFYGQGIRAALFVKATVTQQLQLSAKLGYTNYFDRAVIGTGQQQIAQSHTTDLDLQLRWKF
jgi:hypothetical protein